MPTCVDEKIGMGDKGSVIECFADRAVVGRSSRPDAGKQRWTSREAIEAGRAALGCVDVEDVARMDIDAFAVLRTRARSFDALLENALSDCASPDELRYVIEPAREMLGAGGKRLRPILCELACELVGGKKEQVLSSSLALEMFHSAALIHDDVEDRSSTRHGAACLYRTQGEGVAINTGDFLMAEMLKLVAFDESLPEHTRMRVVGELSAMISKTVTGQAIDIGWARDGRLDISIEEYLSMADKKSACYSAATPLAIGAIVGNADDDQVEVLRSCGSYLGVAFQIADDILDIEGTEGEMGKAPLSDVAEGKRTFVTIHALETSPYSNELAMILSSKTEDAPSLERARSIIEQARSVEHGYAAIDELTCRALDLLESSFTPCRPRSILASLFKSMRRRTC